jgi:hypothetical protein
MRFDRLGKLELGDFGIGLRFGRHRLGVMKRVYRIWHKQLA